MGDQKTKGMADDMSKSAEQDLEDFKSTIDAEKIKVKKGLQDEEEIRIRDDVVRLAMEDPYVTQVQGFYYSAEKKMIRCDIIVSFSVADRNEVYNRVIRKVQEHYPGYSLLIALGSDFDEDT